MIQVMYEHIRRVWLKGLGPLLFSSRDTRTEYDTDTRYTQGSREMIMHTQMIMHTHKVAMR
jgi:hypothetical protein